MTDLAPQWVCTRCGRDEIDGRNNGCERGPCPMAPVPTSPTFERPLWVGKWRIYATDPLPPIPTWKQFAFSYTHDDYDGAPDAGDSRHGYTPSVAGCIAAIREHEDDSR